MLQHNPYLASKLTDYFAPNLKQILLGLKYSYSVINF